ncbi:hypothetical protein HpVH26_13810 [Helicobacter pylori]|nr:hypothetical protein VN1197_10510 [Helicobacter pylori]GHP81540.1 hypothetical protein VN0244_08620 [Helicobacter pylori]GHQ50075.1 hypothetical protein VN0363_10380 [Helicobacter pylori]GHR74508.1 hypothetical protein VN1272_10460 [Helicobacter pylori]
MSRIHNFPFYTILNIKAMILLGNIDLIAQVKNLNAPLSYFKSYYTKKRQK